jgi:hypothetical protein
MKKNLLFILLALLAIQRVFAQVPSYVPTNGLVGYWPFNGNANDESGNGNNGSYTGVLTNDRFGFSQSAISLNGMNNLITLPGSNSLNTDNFTISFWTLPNSYNIHNKIQYGVIGGSLRYSLNWSNSFIGYSPMTCAGGYASSGNSTSINGVSLSQWHLITFVIEGTSTKFYLNGNLIQIVNTAVALTCFLPNMNLYFGGDIGGGSIEYYNGLFDDIGIWNRTLSQQEITNLYNSVSSSECLTMTINTGVLSTNPVTYTSTVNIYPNPANDQITIDCGNLANVVGWNIKITNMLGQEVFNQPMNTQQYVVPLNTWTGQGMYFVKIINAQNEVVNIKKIILQ